MSWLPSITQRHQLDLLASYYHDELIELNSSDVFQSISGITHNDALNVPHVLLCLLGPLVLQEVSPVQLSEAFPVFLDKCDFSLLWTL